MRHALIGLLCLNLFMLACAGSSATPFLASARTDKTTFFVENHGKESRQIEQIIVEAMRARGIQATSGDQKQAPADTDFIITYEDRWAWDMRTYLRLIQIDIRDPKTGAIVATSRSHQTSLPSLGNTYQEIIQRTTDRLFEPNP